ncbi:MAG: CPBP family intramembrane metalloprotease [Promethearchaeota archaeon]|nr:MAG: CPBP family intramembrane metalloprotease [Candidatus Lokiarchaeota archaeon]
MANKRISTFIINNQLISYFMMVLIISWSFWIPMALHKCHIIYFPIPIIVGSTIGAFSPLITLIIFEKITKGSISLNTILSTYKPNRQQIPWLILAAFIIPLSYVIANIFFYLNGLQSTLTIMTEEPFESLGFWLFIIIPVTFFATVLFSSPLGEEPGWRGFAMPRLQSKFGLNLGSLMLGTFWWTWHQPINVANGLEISLFSYITMVLSSFIYDSLFNLSKRRILTAMFAHASTFITNIYIVVNSNNWWIVAILFLFVILLRIYEIKKNKIQLENSEN